MWCGIASSETDRHKLMGMKKMWQLWAWLKTACGLPSKTMPQWESPETLDSLPIVRVHENEFVIRVDRGDSLELLRQPFELDEVHWVTQLVHPAQIVLDVGANIGYYTLLLSRLVGASGKVHAFEPDPSNAAILQRNLADNQCHNVMVHQVAVGNKDATIGLYRCADNAGMHRAYESVCCSSDAVEVRSVVLDQVMRNESRIDFIKMDIEGYEYFALEGMDRIIREYSPTILVEFSPFALAEAGVTATAFIQFFADRNYAISSIGSTRVPIDFDDLFARAAVFDGQAAALLKNARYKSLSAFGGYLVSEFEKMQKPFEILDSWLCEKQTR